MCFAQGGQPALRHPSSRAALGGAPGRPGLVPARGSRALPPAACGSGGWRRLAPTQHFPACVPAACSPTQYSIPLAPRVSKQFISIFQAPSVLPALFKASKVLIPAAALLSASDQRAQPLPAPPPEGARPPPAVAEPAASGLPTPFQTPLRTPFPTPLRTPLPTPARPAAPAAKPPAPASVLLEAKYFL